MARPPGSRNADFEEKRAQLAQAASQALIDGRGMPTSLGAMASAAGVTVPTLKHYFGDHDGVVAAALEEAERQGEIHLAAARDPGRRRLSGSMRALARGLVEGWRYGVGALFAGGLVHGLGHEARGRAAVDHLLEPTLQAIEARLAVHRERGELIDGADLRVAALAFASPLILALLHQDQLSGSQCRPLDVLPFVDAHVDGWLRGWSAAPS